MHVECADTKVAQGRNTLFLFWHIMLSTLRMWFEDSQELKLGGVVMFL